MRTAARQRDLDTASTLGAVHTQHARRTVIAAAVRRQHGVTDLDLVNALPRSVTHSHSGTRDEALIHVADDHHAAVFFGEHADEFELRGVGVLELVDEHMLEPALVAAQRFGVLAEEPHREHEQIVEVDRGCLGEAPLVLGVHLGDAALGRTDRHLAELVGQYEFVLQRADLAVQRDAAGTASGRD